MILKAYTLYSCLNRSNNQHYSILNGTFCLAVYAKQGTVSVACYMTAVALDLKFEVGTECNVFHYHKNAAK